MEKIQNESDIVNNNIFDFEKYHQFILLDISDKTPVLQSSGYLDPETKNTIGLPSGKNTLYNPKNWISLIDIFRYMKLYPDKFLPGFIFTEESNLFFIDLDDCVEKNETQFTVQARDIMSYVPNCYMECSISKKGIHIIGRRPSGFPDSKAFRESYRSRPQSQKKNDTIELYLSKRYVALTFINAQGSINNIGDNLTVIADKYCARNPKNTSAPWTDDQPKPEWSGPKDDDDLILKMLNFQATDASVVFGSKVSFRDLWEFNETKLSEAYPAQNPNDVFNRSLADQALVGWLAFGTGCHRSRIKNIMSRTRFVREKWDRQDYIEKTIDTAIKNCSKVYNDKFYKAQPIVSPPLPDGTWPPGSLIYSKEQFENVFQGVVYVSVDGKMYLPDGSEMSRTAFSNCEPYSNYFYYIISEGSVKKGRAKTTSDCAKAFTQNKLYRQGQARVTIFDPLLQPWSLIHDSDEKIVFNLYREPNIKAVEGDVSWYYDFLKRICPIETDRNIMNTYFHSIVKNYGSKFMWAIALQGAQGIGKDTLIRILSYMLGSQYVHDLRPELLEKEFNGWLYRKLLINVEEFNKAIASKCYAKIRGYITNDKFGLEQKGVDNRMVKNTANFIFTTNDKEAIAPFWSERRIAPISLTHQTFEDRQDAGLTDRYFSELYTLLKPRQNGRPSRAVEALYHHFTNTDPNPEYDPLFITTAPITSFHDEAKEISRSPLAELILEAVDNGTIPGFKNDMVFIRQVKTIVDYPVNSMQLKKAMTEINFIPHPLYGAKFSSTGRHIVYLRKGHMLLAERNRDKFQQQCVNSQGFNN
jgi:hypothetical protein